jgi:hypothetical protein
MMNFLNIFSVYVDTIVSMHIRFTKLTKGSFGTHHFISFHLVEMK